MNIKIKIGLFVFIVIGVVILNITYKNKIIKKKPVSKKLTGFRSDIGVIKKRKYYFFIRLRASRAKGLLTDSLNVTCHANGLPFIASEAYTTPL